MSTLSVHRLENVQDFDMANTPFVTAFNAANDAFAVTNAAFNTTNTAYNFANTVNTFAYGVAVNSAAAFAAANNVAPQVTPAFLTGNLAYALANNAYASINSNWTVTNALYSVANSAYGAANNVGPQIAPTYNTANAAFAAANTKFSSSGGTISGAVEITADLTVHGNTRFVDQQTLSVGDPLIYLAANNYASDVVDIGFVANYVNTGGANVHTGLYRSSGTKEYYLFYGYDKEPLNNYIDPTGNNITMAVLNSTVRTSNLILGGANTINWITSNYNTTNASFGVSNAAFLKANNALANTTGTFAGSLTVTGTLSTPSTLSGGKVSGGTNADPGTASNYGLQASGAYGGGLSFTDGAGAIGLYSTGNGTYLNFAFGGTTSLAGKAALDSSGNFTANYSSRAPLFYDSDDTSYYVDPASSSLINTMRAIGVLRLGTNTNYVNINYDQIWRPDNGQLHLQYSGSGNLNMCNGGGYAYVPSTSLRAPIFYDQDNTGYYTDPASTSVLNQLNVYQINVNEILPQANPYGRSFLGAGYMSDAVYSNGSPILGDGVQMDLLAFNPPQTVEYYNGSTWSSGSVVTDAFKGRNSMRFGNNYSLNTTSQQRVRFTWTNFGYRFWDYLLICGNSQGQVFYGTIEGSSDGVTWTTMTAETSMGNSWPGYHFIRNSQNNNGIATYFRITIRMANGNGNPGYIQNISLFGTYGSATPLLDWDSSRNITTYGTLATGSRGITKASMPAGSILQVQQAFYTAATTLASGTFTDYPGLSITITPSSSSSKFLLMYHLQMSLYGTTIMSRFVRNGSAIGVGDAAGSRNQSTTGWLWPTGDTNHQAAPMVGFYLDSPATASAITYKVQAKTQSGGTSYINYAASNADNSDWAHRSTSSFTVFEVAV